MRSRSRSRAAGPRATARAWAELLRLPALFTVPGDALAGAAAVGARPTPRTLLAIGSSLCLYEAGMALNDWADRTEDAAERPHRPLPSGRVHPAAAFAAAGALTAAGLTLAACAGRPALAVGVPLAATVWAYDLALKRTPAGPVAMATARGLDLLLGAAATTGGARGALPSAIALGTHTFAVTTVSRRETQGGSSGAPLAALAVTAGLAGELIRGRARRALSATGVPGGEAVRGGGRPALSATGVLGGEAVRGGGRPALSATGVLGGEAVRGRGRPAPSGEDRRGSGRSPAGSSRDLARLVRVAVGGGRSSGRGAAEDALCGALTVVYAVTSARPLFHAALNPSPPLTQRAVGGGIRALIPLQAALAARAGAPVVALLTAALAPAARTFARKVSVT